MNRLPLTFDLTPAGEIVPRANLGEEGYAENVEYHLSMHESEGHLIIGYYGEDDSTISIEEYFIMTAIDDEEDN